MRYNKRILLIIISLIIINGLNFGKTAEGEGTWTIDVERTTEAPTIDGIIDDQCWQEIEPVTGFFQYDPDNGARATEETFVRIAYDQKYIYFAMLMKDSEPDKIWAELTPRNQFWSNDSIEIILDTYNDQRTSIRFTVNPRGVQKNSQETIWKSGAKMRTDGWSAEIAIPFKSLRFSTQEEQIWGINFERYISRKRELSFWTHVKRDKPRLQQMGKIRGLKGIKPSYNIELFPYFGYRTSKWDDEKDNKAAVGLDFKYGILPNLTLDMTASPDFSDVESDPFIYQLSPYENFLQENRLFFNEGSHYFASGWNRASFDLFYSRRIHSPRFAAKMTGKTGGISFGVLGALNKEEEGENRFYSVFRVKKDIFENSQIGIYYAGMDDDGGYNRNFAFDYKFNIKDVYYIRGQSAFSYNKNTPHKGIGMHAFQFERESYTGWQYGLFYKRVEENVAVETGYVSKTDYQYTDLSGGYAWRFSKGKVKRISTSVSAELQHDIDGNLTSRSGQLYGNIRFFSNLNIRMGVSAGKSKAQVYDEFDELYWSDEFIDEYGGNLSVGLSRSGFLKSMNFSGSWRHKGIYNDEFTQVKPGTRTNFRARFTLRPKSNFEFSLGGEWTRQVLEENGEVAFQGITYNTKLHYQFSRNLFFSSRLMGETRDDQYNVDFLLGYYFGAGNVVQLSYKTSRRLEDMQHEKGYSITLKISYLLRV
jgi:hypothetical protein